MTQKDQGPGIQITEPQDCGVPGTPGPSGKQWDVKTSNEQCIDCGVQARGTREI